MRIALISDIHANYRALQGVLADIDLEEVDEIISLGDNIGYGPEPEEVIQALRQRQIISIMGNHELGLADEGYFKRLNPGPQDSLELNRQLMGRESIDYVCGLPRLLIRHGARFIHGCPPRSITSYLYSPSMAKVKKIFAGYPEQFCFYGHVHSLECFFLTADGCQHLEPEPGIFSCEREVRYLFNPGSVGQPRDGLNRLAKYAIWDLDQQTLEVRQVSYDVATTKKLLKERGFPEANSFRL